MCHLIVQLQDAHDTDDGIDCVRWLKLHKQTGITIVKVTTIAHTVLTKQLCDWWVSFRLGKTGGLTYDPVL